MPISDIDAGRIFEKLETMHSDLSDMKKDIVDFGKFQVKTEERLVNGVHRFASMDERIKKQEERQCPEIPATAKPKTIYLAITIGFAFIGALITIFNFLS